jgi:hypothetical protein
MTEIYKNAIHVSLSLALKNVEVSSPLNIPMRIAHIPPKNV